MSTVAGQVQTPSKKRKSQDEQQKSHKKRKHDEKSESANDAGHEVAPKSVKKDKKKSKEKSREEKVGSSRIVPVANSDIETPKSSQKEKKSKKHSDDPSTADHEVIVLRSDAEEQSSSQKKQKKQKKQSETQSQLETQQDTITVQDDEAQEPNVNNEDDEEVVMTDAPAANGNLGTVVSMNQEQMTSPDLTAFHQTRASLYVPLPPHGMQFGVNGVIALHLSPLLLSYFPTLHGVVLGYEDVQLSAKPQTGLNLPLIPPQPYESETTEETRSRLGDEFGATWTWITATFLVFRPEAGEELTGWTNAMSEGFIGLVSYNWFQSAISQSRIPETWTWSGPSRQRKKGKKGKLNDSQDPSQPTDPSQTVVEVRGDDAIDGNSGHFIDEHERKVPKQLKFTVVDLEMIPAQERGSKFALQIEGSLLDEQAEQRLRDEEKQKWEERQVKNKPRSRQATPIMSGGLAGSRAGSIIST